MSRPKLMLDKLYSATQFPQAGSFAASRIFSPKSIDENKVEIESQNFVYESPRNKNYEVKRKVMSHCLNKIFGDNTLLPASGGRRNAILVHRTLTSMDKKPKVYNKVNNQKPHLDRKFKMIYLDVVYLFINPYLSECRAKITPQQEWARFTRGRDYSKWARVPRCTLINYPK